VISITIEGKAYQLPASIMDITLQDRIDFDQKYGMKLRGQLKKIIEMRDGVDREMEFTSYHFELATKTLSFFGKVPLDVVENTNITDVLSMYHTSVRMITDEIDFSDKEFKLQLEFKWEGDTWWIAPPVLKQDSAMSFGEFIQAKQVVKNMYKLGDQKYASLLPLACVYFRKKGEEFSDELLVEDGPRQQLLKSLPLQYALHVGFFLNSCLHSWLLTYRSSIPEVTEKASQN